MPNISDVQICSNALMALGSQSINDFNESNDRARLCANLYETVRDDLIREHPWNCCIKRVLLAPDVERPPFGYQYNFTLPSDFIRLLSLDDVQDYTLEGVQILTNEQALKMRYVFRNVNPETYDNKFISLLQVAMEAKLAYAITQSTSMAQFRLQEFQLALAKAKTIDGMETPPDTLGVSPLLMSRLYG